MKKVILVLSLFLAACSASPSAPVEPPATPIDLTSIQSGERFAGLVEGNIPFNIVWYTIDNLPSDAGITATIRSDGGINLRIDDIPMPVWNSHGNWKMSDSWIASDAIDFAQGSIGAAGIKDNTVAYVRQINEQWQIGVVNK